MSKYDKSFMEYAARSSDYSARTISRHLSAELAPKSVLDVGCAIGAWLRAWAAAGVDDYMGIDGDYVDIEQLLIPAQRFKPHNLNLPFDLGRRFDLVQSLEVGEHIEPAAAEGFVGSITQHAERFVLFSASPPGQGGEHHINERPYDFWRSEFAKHGFVAIDAVRDGIAADKAISYWYRFNTILYVRSEILGGLPDELRQRVVPAGQPLRDVSPLLFRMRKAVIRRLPSGVQNGIARFKARLIPTGRL